MGASFFFSLIYGVLKILVDEEQILNSEWLIAHQHDFMTATTFMRHPAYCLSNIALIVHIERWFRIIGNTQQEFGKNAKLFLFVTINTFVAMSIVFMGL